MRSVIGYRGEVKAVEDKVLYTPGLATVIIELRRRITAKFDEECGLAYLSCCLLASLRSHGGTMLISEFPSSMIANENTIVASVIGLARKGLIKKTRSDRDRRVVVLHETAAGSLAAERAVECAYNHLRSTVWRRYSGEEIEEVVELLHGAADDLGISDSEFGRETHACLTPAFFMVIAAMIRQWTVVVSECSELSLTEYRLLALLESRQQPLLCSVMADALMLDRSTTSAAVKSLHGKKLVRIKKGLDKRQRSVSPTESGRASAALATNQLERRTAVFYEAADPAFKERANGLFARLHDELAAWSSDERSIS